MPFKTLDDVNDPAAYEKNVKAGLKAASDGKVAKLMLYDGYLFPKIKKVLPLVLVGPVDDSLIKHITNAGAKLKGKGSITEAEDTIKFKASGVAADLLVKALKHAKVNKEAVAVENLAEAEGEKQKEAPLVGDKALEAAKTKFAGLNAQYEKVLKFANANDKSRLEAHKNDYDAHVKENKGKEALESALFIEKFLGEVESRFDVKKSQVLKQATTQESRINGYKPPLHAKNKEEVENRIKRLTLKMNGAEPPDWNEIDKELDGLEKRFDAWDELADEFATGAAEYNQLKTKSKPLMKLMTPAKVGLLSKEKKGELKERTTTVGKLKEPTVLLAKDAWADAVDAYKRLNSWLEENAVAKDDTETDPVIRRMKTFVHDKPGTWELNPVEYKNRTSASDIGGKANDLKIAALSSNTTAGGSVLKVNFEGHSHLDGGSGGVAFVYKLNDDYTVTPIVVDISGKRGGKNGNQYEWNTGGGWAYFPPNASY